MTQAERVDHGAPIDPVTVRFRDAAMEARFRAAGAEADLRQLRLSVIVGLLVNLGFAPIDALVLSENLAFALVLRLGVATVLLCGVLALLFTDMGQRRSALAGAVSIGGYTLIYAALNAATASPDLYLSGYVLIQLFILVFVPVGFVAACAIVWPCTILFAATVPLTRDIAAGPLITLYAQFLAANVLGMFALYWVERYKRLDFRSLEAIEGERRRYHDLLTRILPRSIVTRLEGGERNVADDFADTTVLFADIVGFTEIAARLAPAQVVSLLNDAFGRFDALAARRGTEKIKTIGDAYMAAGGVPEQRPDHAEAVAEFALDLVDEITRLRAPDGTPLRIRVGLHTGPLTAGVIGESRFGYDLWGDTVNTASRMEGLSVPGRILVSDAAHERLDGHFVFEPHGEIEVKGKGGMRTWYLTGRKEGPAGAASPP